MSVTEYFDNIVWEKNVYRRTQNLNELQFRLILAGISPPDVMNSCELGFGNGVSLLANAASSSRCSWHGTDFNKLHFQYARQMADKCQLDVNLRNQNFAEYEQETHPSFQAVSLMGCWSWITPEAREEVVQFLAKNLADGGVFSFDYLTDPGQAQFAPFRKFVRDYHHRTTGENLTDPKDVHKALGFVRETMKQNPWYLRAYPDISDFLSKKLEDNPEYFLHEFLNVNWEPMSFSEVADLLEPATLTFGCDAEYSEAVIDIQFDARQLAFLSDTQDPVIQETTRDFIRLRGSRTDYWIKNPKYLNKGEHLELLNKSHFALLRPPSVYDYHTSGTLGPFLYEREISQDVLQNLKERSTLSFETLFSSSKLEADALERFCNIITILISEGMIAPVDTGNSTKMSATNRFNDLVLEDDDYQDITVLTSPLTGGGILQTKLHKRFLQGIRTGIKKPKELTDYAVKIAVDKEKNSQSSTEILQEAELFLTEQVEILRNLGLL